MLARPSKILKIEFGKLGKPRTKSISWSGWFKVKSKTAIVANLTKDAVKKAKNAGYDDELFHSVYWAQFPEMVKLALNTRNGKFQVTYMLGEH